MSIFLRIIILSAIFLGIIFYFKPDLIKKYSFWGQDKTINLQEYTLTPDPSNLFLVNLKVSASKNYSFAGIEEGTKLYFQAIDLFKVNILNLLEDSSDKKATLNTYLASLENILNKIDNSISSLTSLYTQEESLAQDYYQQKQAGDQLFSQGFIEKDTSTVIEGLNQSYKNGPEYMKHRIIANAGKIVVGKLTNIKQLLQAKLLLLQNNQEDIVENFNLIKGNLLPKLLELKRRLENNIYY